MLSRINLAPVRFRRACGPGGPVARLEWTTVGLYGRTLFQANAWLREGLRPARNRTLYGNADGTGSATTASVARHKAISEAIERWAHDATYAGPDRGRFGFDVDASSSGLAAFPGFLRTAARPAARAEAIERASLIAWSAGLAASKEVPTRWEGIDAVQIDQPFEGSCVILYRQHPLGFYSYGHASAETFADACERAVVELGRNEYALSRSSGAAGGAAVGPTGSLFERRCRFFATAAGHAAFRRRIGTGRNAWRPEVLIDAEIPGPWSSYATVWRVLYRPPAQGFLGDNLDFFLW